MLHYAEHVLLTTTLHKINLGHMLGRGISRVYENTEKNCNSDGGKGPRAGRAFKEGHFKIKLN